MWIALGAAVVVAILGVGGIVWGVTWVRVVGAAAILASLMASAALSSLLQPRLLRDGDDLLVRLSSGTPERVPLKHVEVFFFGQGPAMTGPRGDESDEDKQDQTSNVVIRLAESAPELHKRSVDRRLGHWCDGYIVIRGTYCEPLSKELLTNLNRQLVEHHRRDKQASADA